jgi:hypothetical protein
LTEQTYFIAFSLVQSGDAWTYCISKNEWIQFNHPYTEKPRLWHTACASDEGEVIVFGGCANNLLVHHRAVSIPLYIATKTYFVKHLHFNVFFISIF